MNFLSIISLSENNWWGILFFALGGLGLFLFGMTMMSSSLKNLAGNKLKILIKKTTDTTFKGILVGMIVTCLIQSSSGATVIVVGLIAAGLMTFKQSIGVILGANIGTTITAFIIGSNISDYALPIIFVGTILAVFVNRKKIIVTGEGIVGFGLLFLGLELMGTGLKGIANTDFFTNIMNSLSDNWFLNVLIGTGFTAAIQSSSAFIGIVQKLYENGSIPLITAIPLVLGSNIGTTVTALIASLSANRESKQASISNVIFKVIGVILFFPFIGLLTSLFQRIENSLFGAPSMLTIAFFHLFFNIITTTILLLLTKYFIMLVEKIVPSNKGINDTGISAFNLNNDLLEESPVLALESSKKSIIDMAYISLQMVQCAKGFLNENNENHFNNCMALEEKIDLYDHLIHDYLMRLHTEHLNTTESMYQAVYLDTIRDLERIGDHSVNLVEFFKDRYENNIGTSEETLTNLNYFFDQIIHQVSYAIEAFQTNNKSIAEKIIELEAEVDTLERKYRKAQWNAIDNNHLLADVHYVDILSNLERISDHCNNIAENVIDPYYMKR